MEVIFILTVEPLWQSFLLKCYFGFEKMLTMKIIEIIKYRILTFFDLWLL